MNEYGSMCMLVTTGYAIAAGFMRCVPAHRVMLVWPLVTAQKPDVLDAVSPSDQAWHERGLAKKTSDLRGIQQRLQTQQGQVAMHKSTQAFASNVKILLGSSFVSCLGYLHFGVPNPSTVLVDYKPELLSSLQALGIVPISPPLGRHKVYE
eukprot:scaffold71889_cov18-Tisochrysis_lutea.AAC.1